MLATLNCSKGSRPPVFYGPKFFRALGIPCPRFNVTDLNNDIKSIQNLDVFKNMIKTVLFREAFIS